MKLRLKISITDKEGEGYMGIGLVWLLLRIKKFKSINRAARDMNLSYAKALKILNRLEENLGRKILIRKRGGRERGGAELTPFAERFIEEYDRFQADIKKYSEKRFSEFKKKFLKKNKIK
jgi:molybdate transport system regulatory protein